MRCPEKSTFLDAMVGDALFVAIVLFMARTCRQRELDAVEMPRWDQPEAERLAGENWKSYDRSSQRDKLFVPRNQEDRQSARHVRAAGSVDLDRDRPALVVRSHHRAHSVERAGFEPGERVVVRTDARHRPQPRARGAGSERHRREEVQDGAGRSSDARIFDRRHRHFHLVALPTRTAAVRRLAIARRHAEEYDPA